MPRPSRFRISLKSVFLLILALSAGLAILRQTGFNLHQAIGVAATILAAGFLLFLAVLYFIDLIDLTTWAMRAWEKRRDSNNQ